ncbi:uncharacterized protein FIESC28_02601 [Fusarium coffeatum]|uniref:Uncharacterized protein n=1 Tax=Fusarium coffeatum TaxID=231269 RepID=A0A366S700_9HYPO|nr:uncharacterized protein FIESC28_02601 [Fusarium coffeatum]RBR24668.1 hypothetical protein FIESC28_02601 [Fusarium coffeatum]
MSSKTLLDMPDELLPAILDHLKKDSYVAKNPLLIGGVRELVIDDTTFPTCINDWNTYKRAVTLWAYTQKDPDFDEDEDDLEEWEIQRRFDVSSSMVITKSMWEHFNSGIKGHHENRLAHADIAALKEALPKMKSLCSLIVTNCTPFEDRQSDSPFARMWRSPPSGGGRRPSWGERPWAPRCDWEPQLGDEPDPKTYSLDWLDDRIFTTVHPGEPDGYDDPYENDDVVYTRDYYNTYKSTIRAACNVGRDPRILSRQARVLHVALHVLEDPDVGPQLQEFRVDSSDSTISRCSPGLPITLFGNQSPFPDRLSRAFSTTNMTELYLILSNFDDGQKGRNIMDHGRVTQLLSSTPQLEQLYFEPHGMTTSGALPQITFPRLHTVEFSCGEVNPDKLIGFLERQGSVLKTLHISNCNIRTDPGQLWGDVADQINHLQRENVTNLQEGPFCQNWVGESQARCWGFPQMDPDYRESEDCVDWYLEDGRLFEKDSFED